MTPEQVLGPSRPGRKIVVSGDTSPCEALRIAAHRADVLVHEATFAEEERARAVETGHSTAAGAATLARDAEVALLALTHVSTRHPVGLLRDEARAVFADTVVPRDFDTLEIPLARAGQADARWTLSAPRRRRHRRGRRPPRQPAQAPPVTSGSDGPMTAGPDRARR